MKDKDIFNFLKNNLKAEITQPDYYSDVKYLEIKIINPEDNSEFIIVSDYL